MVGGFVRLQDRRAKHIVKILKSEPGEILRVGLVGEKIGNAKVVGVVKKYPFSVDLEINLEKKPPPKTPIDIVLALPRPIMLRRIIGQITSLGVGTMHVINAARVEKSFWDAGIIEQDNHIDQVYQGLEQAMDTVPPRLHFHQRFRPFIEDYLPTIIKEYSTLLYADPGGECRVTDFFDDKPGNVLVAIGPEGGWVDYELTKFREIGFSGFTIGPRILRVDTAVVNIHGRIMAAMKTSV